MFEKIPIKLILIKPGLYTTIQDNGRLGYQDQGIPQGGYMDVESANLANWLVANPRSNPVLELTMMGPIIQFEGACQIALTGADMDASINGKATKMNQTINIKNQDILRFGQLKYGLRTYLAVRGTWQWPKWLNSFSTLPPQIICKMPTGPLKKNQVISVVVSDAIIQRSLVLPSITKSTVLLEVSRGPEYHRFDPSMVHRFFCQVYTMSNRFDRMGCLLKGAQAIDPVPGEIISSGLIPGTIQITNAGQPIVVLQDAPVTGGYNRIAVLGREQQNRIAQMCGGQQLQFVDTKK
jgi:antagonist of KipI